MPRFHYELRRSAQRGASSRAGLPRVDLTQHRHELFDLLVVVVHRLDTHLQESTASGVEINKPTQPSVR